LEDEMHPYLTAQIAAEHIATLRQQAAKQRLVGQLRRAQNAPGPNRERVRSGWRRLTAKGSRVAPA
jgi:hypothetical protein